MLSRLSSAASLDVDGRSLGAGTTTVASCDADGMTTSFVTAFDPALGSYAITAVTITGIENTCDQKKLQLVLTNSDGALVGSALVPTLNLPLGATSAVVPMVPVSAELVRGIAIVMSG